MIKSVHNILFLLFIIVPLYANDHYWIYFQQKSNTLDAQCWVSDQTVMQRLQAGLPVQQVTDLPVDDSFTQTLEQSGICIQSKSKWLNAVYAQLNTQQLCMLKDLDFIKKVEKSGYLFVSDNNKESDPKRNSRYYDALVQIKAEKMVESHHNGAGVVIGVVDAGFKSLDTESSLKHLLTNNKIKGFRDYINPKNKDLFNARVSGMVNHGTTVLKYIAGREGTKHYGLASAADFYLAYTDHDATEKRIEEAYWVAALEWFDSLGVKLVNSSLGYADGFDDPSENHKPSEVDGKSTAITQAAQIASVEKGMLIVISAGNDGNSAFQIISIPADAQDVLSVGATQFGNQSKMSYSSTGPTHLPYNKPDISCYSNNGTSFTAPVITGLAACIMQANPKLSNLEIISLIKQSSTLYPYANNYIGYGVPNAEKIFDLLAGKEIDQCKLIRYSEFSEEEVSIFMESDFVIFHKADEHQVVKQLAGRNNKKKNTIPVNLPDSSISRSTFASWKQCIEIIWDE